MRISNGEISAKNALFSLKGFLSSHIAQQSKRSERNIDFHIKTITLALIVFKG